MTVNTEGIAYRSNTDVLDLGATGIDRTGTADISSYFSSAITEMTTNGGGNIKLPSGILKLNTAQIVASNNIGLIGAGSGYGFVNGIPALQASAATRIVWGGSAGATMFTFTTNTGAQVQAGGGMRGIMLDGNGFSAAVGLNLSTWSDGIWQDVNIYACSADHFLLGVVNHSLSTGTGDTQRNLFMNCIASTFGGNGTYLTSTAKGFRLTGGTTALTGNSSFNTFINCAGYMSKGISFKLENSDSNEFIGCNGTAVRDGTVYDFELGSADQDSGTRAAHARFNSFINCAGRFYARAGQSGGVSSASNQIVALVKSNSNPAPAYEIAAGGSLAPTLYYTDQNGMGKFKNLNLLGIPTSASGLSTGDVYSNSGVLTVV